eukprot:CAMPEP_0194033046 /NCGR_PEP_ID=MMETSP0009_2-20130614/5857_1 /TAXON_ID=210454 /ORGANISM="Grammatophora oceanica, Strain CCMP 410" /LENGTH=347 /DNA_ID=CAMNT_0038673655 /DNA_START=340 /DNA_END=1383 /DNA_ORIENTATION=+
MGRRKKGSKSNAYFQLEDVGPADCPSPKPTKKGSVAQSVKDSPTSKRHGSGGGKNNGRKRSDNPRGRHQRQNVEDLNFRRKLEADGSKSITEMDADGNCLFRALADQLFYDYGNCHEEVRHDVCDFIELNETEFSLFLVLDENEEDNDGADFSTYVARMRENGEWGGNVELVAAARLYRRNIVVYSHYAIATIEHGAKKAAGPDLMVSFHDNDHYNSVRDGKRGKPPPPLKFMPELDDTSSKTKATDEETASTTTELTNTPPQVDDSKRLPPKTSKKKKGGPCPCGSGIKYKECCRKKDKKALSEKAKQRKLDKKNGISCGEDETMMNNNSEEGPRVNEDGLKMLKI